MSEFNKAVGKRIRELREECGYSVKKLRGFTGLSESFIYDIEAGRRGVSAENILLLSRVLGVTTDYLILGNQDCNKYTNINSLLDKLTVEEVENIESIIRVFANKHLEYAVL